MYKVVWLLRRKQGLTHEQFRAHFEGSHVPLAQKYIGHLFADYRRNYASEIWAGGDPRKEGGGFGPKPWDYDVISEWIFAKEEDFHELNRILAQPEVAKLFHEDEDRFLDRNGFVMIPCQVVE
jgi:hypothetical protein